MSAPMAQLRTLPTNYSNYGSFSLHQAFIERLLKIKNRFLVAAANVTEVNQLAALFASLDQK
ncbi:hypothetical protein LPL03_27600 [Lactiplantibacillus argentoratensis]|nr:hypothetical protein H073_07515 [Lactiplantibacillus plantarum UCMA 3037]GEO54664.1 hypothetical protein LPL03_27600 [Lactiplantibacillus argentoratensis]